MQLNLVNRRQATRLKLLGFDYPVQELFIFHSYRNFIPDFIPIADNWNKYEFMASRPSVALALQWVRERYECLCEVVVADWNKETYRGEFRPQQGTEHMLTPVSRDRDRAESDLLTKVLAYYSNQIV